MSQQVEIQMPLPVRDKRSSVYNYSPGGSTLFTSSSKFSQITLAESLEVQQPSKLRPIFLSCIASLGGFLFGYDTGTISGFLKMQPYASKFGEYNVESEDYSVPALRAGIIVSGVCIGGLIGGLSASKIAEKFGRTRSVMGFTVVYIAAVIQLILANSWVHVLIARIILGCAIGSFTLIIPMLLSESAPSNLREFNVSIFQLLLTFGIFVGNIIVYGTQNLETSNCYRIPMYISLAIALVLFGSISKMPESPRYLVYCGKIQEATTSVSCVHKVHTNSKYVEDEINSMKCAIEKDQAAGNAGWLELFTGRPRIFYRVVVGTSIQIFQLFSGANYFFYYGTTLFTQIGGMSTYATAIILSSVNFTCTIIGLALVSKLSRRAVLITGSVGMLVSFVLFATLGSFVFHPGQVIDGQVLGLDAQSVVVGKVMIFLACSFIFFYASTWAPLAFVILAEIYPQRVRSKAMSLGCASNWGFSIIVNIFTPFLVKIIGFSIGYIFSGFIFAGLIFVYFFLHETKGLTLEQTDDMYSSGINAIQSANKRERDEFFENQTLNGEKF